MKSLKLSLVLLLVAIICACSGGGGSDDTAPTSGQPNPPDPIAGIGRTGISAGPITGFGSIIVNGVRFETDTASFLINGVPGSQSDLSVGQFIIIKGDIEADLATGTATDVIFNDDVKGPVQSIDLATSSIVVLGQTVLINATTSFDNSIPSGALNGLQLGDIVEVSGIVDATGAISATRIELNLPARSLR